jgi:hypothetical protein
MRGKSERVSSVEWQAARDHRSRLTAHGSPLATRQLFTGYCPLITIHISLLLFFFLSTGCRLLQTASEMPGKTIHAVTPGKHDPNTVDPIEVQQTLIRFADEYSTRLAVGLENLRRGTNTLDPAEVLKWKIALGTETCSIASGANAIANLLDMTVFVTVNRMGLEEYWQPKVFGESARSMLKTCQKAEIEIWRMTSSVLKPEQQAELRQAIKTWQRQSPLPEDLLAARALGITSQMAKSEQPGNTAPASVFNLLNLDPLSGLDPATREIAQTRLFAERALYVSQKMPTLLRWQTELLSLNAMAMPEVRQMVTNSSQIAASVERFARVAEQLPGQLTTEREEILMALQSQEKSLTPLVNEVRQTLMAGSQMSASLNKTLTTFDAVITRFGVGKTNQAAPARTNSEPFRIQEYGQMAVHLEGAARQMTELLQTLDQILDSTNLASLASKVSPAVQLAQTGGKEIVDYAFLKGILLVGIVLAAALLYRFLGARLSSANRPSPPAFE